MATEASTVGLSLETGAARRESLSSMVPRTKSRGLAESSQRHSPGRRPEFRLE